MTRYTLNYCQVIKRPYPYLQYVQKWDRDPLKSPQSKMFAENVQGTSTNLHPTAREVNRGISR